MPLLVLMQALLHFHFREPMQFRNLTYDAPMLSMNCLCLHRSMLLTVAKPLDGELICMEPCRVPDPLLMMEALVPKACHELISYETLETFGDTFLKFAVSVHLYRLYPKAHEGRIPSTTWISLSCSLQHRQVLISSMPLSCLMSAMLLRDQILKENSKQ